jgi:hypothetical protein
MGNTYANITLKGPQAQDILQELSDQGRLAFVSPTEDDLTTVYEMDSDEEGENTLIDLAEDLSGRFGCPALAVQVMGEDLFRYWLYVDGELEDTYTSPCSDRPEHLLESQGGDPESLIQYFNHEVSAEEISDVLHCCDQDCDFSLAADRHLSLVEILGLPLCSVGFGFSDLDSGDYPEELEDSLLRVGD